MGAPINTAFLRPSYFPSTSQALPFPVPAPTPYPPVRPLGTRISDWRQHSMEHSSVLMTRICLKKGSNLSSLVEQRSPPNSFPSDYPLFLPKRTQVSSRAFWVTKYGPLDPLWPCPFAFLGCSPRAQGMSQIGMGRF